MLAGCDTRDRYDVDDPYNSLTFASSLSEAIAICKKEAQEELSEDLEGLKNYGSAFYHTDKDAIRKVTEIRCSTNYVDDDSVSRKRGLDLGEICNVSAEPPMWVEKLIPDEDSVNDPNWNKPTKRSIVLSVVQYPCKNGNGCEKVLVTEPDVRWVVRDPSKCNLPASSLKR